MKIVFLFFLIIRMVFGNIVAEKIEVFGGY